MSRAKVRRQRLTEAIVRGLKHDPARSSWQVVWDTRVDNLGVRVGTTSKRWVLRYRNAAGVQRLWSFGSATQIPVRRARELAQDANVRIVRGEDPSVQKRANRALLQWGRAREGAEGVERDSTYSAERELQWGRAREGAEGAAQLAEAV